MPPSWFYALPLALCLWGAAGREVLLHFRAAHSIMRSEDGSEHEAALNGSAEIREASALERRREGHLHRREEHSRSVLTQKQQERKQSEAPAQVRHWPQPAVGRPRGQQSQTQTVSRPRSDKMASGSAQQRLPGGRSSGVQAAAARAALRPTGVSLNAQDGASKDLDSAAIAHEAYAQDDEEGVGDPGEDLPAAEGASIVRAPHHRHPAGRHRTALDRSARERTDDDVQEAHWSRRARHLPLRQESMAGDEQDDEFTGGDLGPDNEGSNAGGPIPNSESGYMFMPVVGHLNQQGETVGVWKNSGKDDEVAVVQSAVASSAWGSMSAKDETAAESLEHLGSGVGAMTYDRSPSDSQRLNHVFERRLEIQDLATLLLLAAALLATVVVSLMLVYHISDDPSPAAFYSDPRYTHTLRQRVICEEGTAEAFLRAFNTQPQVARLRLIGRIGEAPNVMGNLRAGRFWTALAHLGEHICEFLDAGVSADRSPSWESVLFDVSLDLTPFITGDGRLSSDSDMATLEKHVRAENRLEVIMIHKEVEWPNWEDIATNIKQRLRTLGFPGTVDVHLEAVEEILVYRNDPWQNFTRNRITQALIMLSVVGPFMWLPYLYRRQKTVRVNSKFKVNLGLDNFWEHVSRGLNCRHGFVGSLGLPVQ
mmetsp:Transcript_6166/g.17244  ORF Transcript_6166/g.17244 Transcript_6166/m.17244 type:complete len:652 (+) Transcript_6166:216-2171(+)